MFTDLTTDRIAHMTAVAGGRYVSEKNGGNEYDEQIANGSKTISSENFPSVRSPLQRRLRFCQTGGMFDVSRLFDNIPFGSMKLSPISGHCGSTGVLDGKRINRVNRNEFF